jgi:hypothetical protein
VNIGVIGYYGYGNVGDEFILSNLRQILAPHRVVPLAAGLLEGAGTIRRLNSFDFLILGGGGLYRREPPSPFATFDRWGQQLRTPIGVLGLGFAQLAPRHVTATRALVEKAAFFVVRDEESRELIAHPKVDVAPDLTFYNPLPWQAPRGEDETAYCGVNLRPAHAGIERWIEAVRQLATEIRPLPFSNHPALGDREALADLDPDCPVAFRVEDLLAADVMVATAFHAVVFAIQAGIPFVAIDYDVKVARLMREVGLEQCMLGWNEWEQLSATFAWVLDQREAIRERARAYRDGAQVRLRQALKFPRQCIDDYAARDTQREGHRPQPKVSIVVDATGANEAAIERSVDACRRQLDSKVEVVITHTGGQATAAGSRLLGSEDVRIMAPATVQQGVTATSGEYVTWMKAGAWFADEAITVLTQTLEATPSADLAHACFLLTERDIIQRKVRLEETHDQQRGAVLGPCFLVRRERAAQLWARTGALQEATKLDGFHAVYVRSALYFRPASKAERDVYHALIALARGERERGKQLLQHAGSGDAGPAPWILADDFVTLVAGAARNASGDLTPSAFVALVFAALPAEVAASLRKKVMAQMMMRRFYEATETETWWVRLGLAARGVFNDPAWLRNRGMWATLWRGVVNKRVSRGVVL